jgi:hypothetical protein
MNIREAIQAVRDASTSLSNISVNAQVNLHKGLDALEKALNATATDDKVYDWAKWVERYYAFRRDVGSPVVKLLPADGKGLKEVQAYLVALTGGTYTEAAYQTFDYICTNWKKLTPFVQGMIRPAQMAKFLDEIILKLNPNGAGKTTKEAASNEREQYRRDLAERIAASAGGTSQAQRPEADTLTHNTDR